VKGLVRADPLIHRHWQIARGLQGSASARRSRRGGRDFFTAAARLARLRVTAAVEPAGVARTAGAGARLDGALAGAGVRAIVAEADRSTTATGRGSATGTRGRGSSRARPRAPRRPRRPGSGDAHRARRP
jgi:hypothetical protein